VGGVRRAVRNARLGCKQASDFISSLTQRLSSRETCVDFPGLRTAVIAPIIAFFVPAGFLSSFQSATVGSPSAFWRQWFV
jgi:hypothetical protein